MRKSNKLSNKYEVDFQLFGIVCQEKEYKISWHIGEKFEIPLEKAQDSVINFNDGNNLKISSFIYRDDYLFVNVIRNKLIQSGTISQKKLVPELMQFDYLIKIKDATEALSIEEILGKVRSIPCVNYCTTIDFDKLKSRENLLFITQVEPSEEDLFIENYRQNKRSFLKI